MQQKLGQLARDQANLRNGYGWNKYTETQDKTEDWHTKVHPGYDDIHNTFTTDVQIYDRHSQGSHVHIVFDEYGNEIFNEWRARG